MVNRFGAGLGLGSSGASLRAMMALPASGGPMSSEIGPPEVAAVPGPEW